MKMCLFLQQNSHTWRDVKGSHNRVNVHQKGGATLLWAWHVGSLFFINLFSHHCLPYFKIWTIHHLLKVKQGLGNEFQLLIHNRFWNIRKKAQTLKSAILDFCGPYFHNLKHSSSINGQTQVGVEFQALTHHRLWEICDKKYNRWISTVLHTIENVLKGQSIFFKIVHHVRP